VVRRLAAGEFVAMGEPERPSRRVAGRCPALRHLRTPVICG